MLRVAVDASAIRPRGTGMARYTLGVLRATNDQPALGIQWRLLHPRPDELPADLRRQHVARSATALARPTELWRATATGRLALAEQADVLWCPTGRGPWRRSTPIVLTVHDLLPLRRRGRLALGRRERLLVGTALRRSLQRASVVVAVSHDTALRLRQRHPALSPPIEVVPQAVDGIYHAPARGAALARMAARGLGGARLWLHVGQLTRRKNLVQLLRAFAIVRDTLDPHPRLVLVGPDGDASASVARELRRLRLTGHVRRLPWLPPEDLRALFDHAELVLCPSLHEGFGRVALEAMGAGRPVLSSGRGALGALVAQAGWQVDCTSAQALAAGLRRLTADAGLRARLAAAGPAHAAGYDGRRTARRMAAVFRRAHVGGHCCASTGIQPQSKAVRARGVRVAMGDEHDTIEP